MNLFQEAKEVLDKDGKVNALGPYGRQKLTGREMSTYFRRNKVKDAKIKRAVEVALDLGGAMSVAQKEIKKFYGDKILNSPEVKKALKYANEEVVKEDTDLSENFRTLAKYGMGTETSKSARVGLELDFYDSKGNKKFGKILQKTNTGYLVKDDKGKKHVLKYLDRKKAKDMLKPNYIHTEDAEKKAELALKQTREKEQLAKKHEREKESISDDFKLHPHKGFEGEKLPDRIKDFRKKAMTPREKKKSLMNTYREMWEDAITEEQIVYRVRDIQKPEETKFKQASRFGLKVSMKKQGKDTMVTLSGSKKLLRDFDRIARGKSSYGDPSTVKHFDE